MMMISTTTAASQFMRWWATRKVLTGVLLSTKLVPATGTPAYKREASVILTSRGIKICHILKYIYNYRVKEM